MNNPKLNDFLRSPIIAIIRNVHPDIVPAVCEALYKGGIQFTEITMNSPQALNVIHRMSIAYRDKMFIGAGSVLEEYMAQEAIEAGASFIVSPHVNRNVIEYTTSKGILSFPGAATPTEVYSAYQYGAQIVKVFPSGSLGPQYIKELQGPLDHIPMIVVGGIGVDNAAQFITAGAIGLGVGGTLINKEWIENRQFHHISDYAAKLLQCVRTAIK